MNERLLVVETEPLYHTVIRKKIMLCGWLLASLKVWQLEIGKRMVPKILSLQYQLQILTLWISFHFHHLAMQFGKFKMVNSFQNKFYKLLLMFNLSCTPWCIIWLQFGTNITKMWNKIWGFHILHVYTFRSMYLCV